MMERCPRPAAVVDREARFESSSQSLRNTACRLLAVAGSDFAVVATGLASSSLCRLSTNDAAPAAVSERAERGQDYLDTRGRGAIRLSRERGNHQSEVLLSAAEQTSIPASLR